MTNRELVLTAPGTLTWHDAPAPALRSAEAALIRPLAAATCDFDHLLAAGRTAMPMPMAIGHELVGEVLEVGEGVTRVAAGDRVIVPFQVSCGACAACRLGHTSCCEAVPWLSCYGLGAASGDYGGAVSDVVRVPWADAMLVPLPASIAPEHAAAISCNVPDAYRCVGPQLATRPGARVLIAGGAFGSIAMYAVAIAVGLGAERVDYLDDDPARCARAERLGATAVDAPLGDYPITVDAAMDPTRLAVLLAATAPAGTCTVSCMYPKAPTLPLMEMFARCATLTTGQPHARSLIEPVLDLVAAGRLDLGAMVDDVVGWDDAPAAFATGSGKHVCVR